MKKYSILLITVLKGLFVMGQTSSSFVPDLNVKPAETASLLKFIETPVSYNSGLVNVSVPIYTIKEGDITYPISIDYNSSGVGVIERAGWVGMGFSISQPQVTRAIKGQPDDYGGYIYETDYRYDNIYLDDVYVMPYDEWLEENTTYNWGSGLHEYRSYVDSIDTNFNDLRKVFHQAYSLAKLGAIDLESDDYRIILPTGENIRFFFSQERTTEFPYGKIIQFPITTNKIKPLFSGDYFSGWEVTDSNGFLYTYGSGNLINNTKSYAVSNDLASLDGGSTYANYYTSWMLASIVSPTGSELLFTYNNYSYNDCNLSGQTREVAKLTASDGVVFTPGVTTNYQETYGYNYYLKDITGSFGKVEFNLDTVEREDYEDGKKLNSIKIYDIKDNLVQNYALNYIYRTSASPTRDYHTCSGRHLEEDLIKRMFLEKVFVTGSQTTTANKPFYKFEYDETELPERFSYATDWWGFYNGKDNYDIVPTMRETDEDMPDRNVDPAFSQAGILKKVTYPTGGYSIYEYENNRGILHNAIINTFRFSTGVIKIDNMSIVPSVTTTKEFNSTEETPTSTSGTKKFYDLPFTLGTNIIGYYTLPIQFSSGYGFSVKVKTNCGPCGVTNDTIVSLPSMDDCFVKYIVKKGTETLYTKYALANGEVNLEFAVGANETLAVQNYNIEIEIDSGHPSPLNPVLLDPDDNIQFELSWHVINPATVVRTQGVYEIPVGGHRIKDIKNYESDGVLSLHKSYSYKDSNGLESNDVNFRLTNHFQSGGKAFLTSDNYYPLNSYNGQPVGYRNVTESLLSNEAPLTNLYKYLFYHSAGSNGYNNCYFYLATRGYGLFPCSDDPINGLLIENKIGNEKKIENNYQNVFSAITVPYIKGYNVFNKAPLDFDPVYEWDGAKYEVATFYPHKLKSSNITEDYNGGIESTTTNTYLNVAHQQVTSQETLASNGDHLITKYFYPSDSAMASEPYREELMEANRISTPLVTQNFNGTTKLSEQKTEYKDDSTTYGALLPKCVYANKGIDTLSVGDRRINFDLYDKSGNIRQYRTEGGAPVTIIWGYNRTQPIARIENATFTSITSSLVEDAIDASDSGTEASLITALNAIRGAVPKAMVTTYTYKPLVGVSTITDPKGKITYYEYDSFGRLQYVKDNYGNTISESEYHYRTQN